MASDWLKLVSHMTCERIEKMNFKLNFASLDCSRTRTVSAEDEVPWMG